MAQGPGMSNTAPPPIPGGYGNPTGAQTSPLGSGIPGGIPAAYGSLTPGALPTVPGGSGFPANGTGSGMPSNPSMSTLSTGWGATSQFDPNMGKDISKQLGNDFGAGVGNLLASIFQNGLYNPQVADALIAAMQPQIERGLNSTEAAFGAEGARFGSAAAIGIGDYESQAVLGENQVLAGVYQQDQMAQLNLLENILPTVNKEQDNSQGTSWWQSLLSGGVFGSAVANPEANSGGGGSVSPVNVGSSGTGSPSGSGVPGMSQQMMDELSMQTLDASAGATLGGASGASTVSSMDQLMSALALAGA